MAPSTLKTRLRFSRIDASTVALLRHNVDFLMRELDLTLDAFYRHVEDDAEARRFFSKALDLGGNEIASRGMQEVDRQEKDPVLKVLRDILPPGTNRAPGKTIVPPQTTEPAGSTVLPTR